MGRLSHITKYPCQNCALILRYLVKIQLSIRASTRIFLFRHLFISLALIHNNRLITLNKLPLGFKGETATFQGLIKVYEGISFSW